MIITKTKQELKEVLMNPAEAEIAEPYYLIEGQNDQKITVVSPGKNGPEFNKTYGCFNTSMEVVIVHIAFGQGVMALQRNDEEGGVKEFRVTSLRPGAVVEVPSGYGFCLVNIGKNFLITVDNLSCNEKSCNIKMVQEKHGLAYYVIDKKGEVGFEANPHYQNHPQIATY